MLRRALWTVALLCTAGCFPAHHVVRDGSEYVGLEPASSPEEWSGYAAANAKAEPAPSAPPLAQAPAAEKPAVAKKPAAAKKAAEPSSGNAFVDALHSAMKAPEPEEGTGGSGEAGEAPADDEPAIDDDGAP